MIEIESHVPNAKQFLFTRDYYEHIKSIGVVFATCMVIENGEVFCHGLIANPVGWDPGVEGRL